MKTKFILMAALVCGTLASCTKKDEPTMAPSNQEISFETPIVAPTTKAITGVIYPVELPFTVSAKYYTDEATKTFDDLGWSGGSAYMSDVKVIAKDFESKKAWSSETGKYYWPKTGSLTFQAYAPFNAAGASIGDSGVKFAEYTVATDLSQVELLYSNRTKDQTSTHDVDQTGAGYPASPVYHGAQITFNHALAATYFQAKAKDGIDLTTTTIQITDVHFKQLQTKASFDQGLANTDVSKAMTHCTAWTLPATPIKADYSNMAAATPVDLTATAAVTPFQAVAQAGVDNQGVLVLPQLLTDDAVISVTCQMKIGSSPWIEWTKEVKLNTLTYTGATDTTKEFEVGRKYTFTIIVDLEEIHFAPTIVDWIPVTTDLNI